MPRRKGDDEFAVNQRRPLTTTIRPPFGEPANAETARSISPASDSPIGFNSTSNEFATAVYHDAGTAEHYTTWPGYCLKALRVNSRTRLAFAPATRGTPLHSQNGWHSVVGREEVLTH